MFSRITVDIQIDVDLDTFTPSVEVDIVAGDELPGQVVMAAVEGGLKAVLRNVQERQALPNHDNPPITDAEY